MTQTRSFRNKRKESQLNSTHLPPLPQQHSLFMKRSSKETKTSYFDCRCIVFHDQQLDYIVDKPKGKWLSQLDDFSKTFSLDTLVTQGAEHVGETVWMENVQLKLLCFNFKRHRYRHFKVYDVNGSKFRCFHVKEWFKKVITDIVFIYDDAIPLDEVFGRWNDILQHLRFNILIEISNREDHKLIRMDPISSPCYNNVPDQLIKPEFGSKWRVPNPNLKANQIDFMNVELISLVRIPTLNALTFDAYHKMRILGVGQSQIITIGPVKIQIVDNYTIEKCKVCMETCPVLNHSRNIFNRDPQAGFLTIEFLVYNNENMNETFPVFGYVGDLESKSIYDKMRGTFDDMKLDVYLRIQHSNNHCCKDHDEESKDNIKHQILNIWHAPSKPEMLLDSINPFQNWYNDVDEIIDKFQIGYVEGESDDKGDEDEVDWISMGVDLGFDFDNIEKIKNLDLSGNPKQTEEEKVGRLYNTLFELNN